VRARQEFKNSPVRNRTQALPDSPLPPDPEKFAKASSTEKPNMNPALLSRSNFIASRVARPVSHVISSVTTAAAPTSIAKWCN